MHKVFELIRENIQEKKEFKLIASPPRIELLDGCDTLKQHNMAPRATLIIEGDVVINTNIIAKYGTIN